MMKFMQPFHLVTYSPWPFLISLSLLIQFIGILNLFSNYNYFMMLYGMILFILCVFQWWRDVIREGTYQGFHTYKVVSGLKLGMILFIISEVFFFISIFWCYFHMFLSPSIELGELWPPLNIISFNPYNVPLFNTLILLSSGIFITLCHYSMMMSYKKMMMVSMLLTIKLGLIFSMFQYIEYYEAMFTMADSVYGSVFFMSTGFHGLHVLVGTIFLCVNLIRMFSNNYSSEHYFGFEAASWYWHFVDVIWLFLYLLVYFWSY